MFIIVTGSTDNQQEDQCIDVEALSNLQTSRDISANEMNAICTSIRKALGRKSVESLTQNKLSSKS